MGYVRKIYAFLQAPTPPVPTVPFKSSYLFILISHILWRLSFTRMCRHFHVNVSYNTKSSYVAPTLVRIYLLAFIYVSQMVGCSHHFKVEQLKPFEIKKAKLCDTRIFSVRKKDGSKSNRQKVTEI